MNIRQDERGAVTAFVVVFTTTLLLVAGLVIDGGFVLAARRTAINEAEAAARAGAQAVRTDVLRADGPVTIDPAGARHRALEYLAGTGHDGTVDVVGDTVRVEVSFTKPLTILGLAGLGRVTVRGTGEAQGVMGLVEEGP
ncbi:MAG: pilus assembly protein TadG-related protein [Nocardioidaceae bacterium]